ncbi:MAG: glycosyltransferase family 39 protein [Clostridia bacterium]|nr:glycosyltransferase family 39 protein [Clostridia bacterium]
MKLRKVMHALLLAGMGLMIPCYAFTVLNVTLSPWPLYGRSRMLLTLLTAACAAGLLLGMRWLDGHDKFFERNERRVLVFAAAFYFIVQMAMAHALRFVPKTDAEQCFTAAQLIVDTGTFGNVERPWVYFTRYPFNLGFVYLLAGIFRVFGAIGWGDRFMQAALVCSVLFTLGLLAGARVVRRLGGARAQARLLVLFASCLPFLYCTTELYTDAFSLAFPTMTVYCFVRLRDASSRKGRVCWALGFALCAFAGAQIKFTAVIAAIACVIALFFERQWSRAALSCALLIGALVLGGAAVDSYTHTHLSEEDIAKNELPRLHHIAMGLPVREHEGYGQYGDGGWLIFSTSFEDPQERSEALMTEIIDRVYYLRFPNRLLNMMSRKNLSTFGNGTFALHEIIQADDYAANNAVKQVIFSQGRYSRAYYYLCTALFMAQMIVAIAACAQAIRRRNTAGAPLFIALVGVFLILCAWETNARYFFQFEMVLLCAGALLDSHRKNV